MSSMRAMIVPEPNAKFELIEGGKGEYELTEHAVKFIEENKDHPFFLYLAHNCPHVPLAAKPEQLAQARAGTGPGRRKQLVGTMLRASGCACARRPITGSTLWTANRSFM